MKPPKKEKKTTETKKAGKVEKVALSKSADLPAKKEFIDEDDDDFETPIDDIGGFEQYTEFDDDDDY